MALSAEIKKQYKQTIQPMGIYCIRNTANGKCLIGSSKNLPGKLNSHKFQLEFGVHMNKELDVEFKHYGSASFQFEILDQLQPKEDPAYSYDEDLQVLLEMWLDKLQPYDEKGYNKRLAPKKL